MANPFKGLANRIYKDSYQPTEEERLLTSIEAARGKLDRAWANLQYAAPEYIDVAILDVKQAEIEYGLLNRKYRMLIKTKFTQEEFNPRLQFIWLNKAAGVSQNYKSF